VCDVDRCTLEDRGTVERSHQLLLDCLLYLLAKNHVDDPLIFARITAVIVSLRSQSQQHSLAEERFVIEWQDKVDFPPVFFEMWS